MKLIALVFSVVIFYSCLSSRSSFTIEDSYPRKGEIIDCTIPEKDCDGRQGSEECVYKTNSMKSYVKYHMDKIVDSYLIIGSDTFNRLINNKKEGKWMEYIPEFSYLRINYYVSDEIKYLFAIYHGDKIVIKHFNTELKFVDGDTILARAIDTSFCNSHKIPKTKYSISNISMYDKRNLRSFTYRSKNKTITSRCYYFYKNNTIGATLDMVNNEYQVDSIYNQKGELICVSNEKTKERKILGSKSDLKKFDKMMGKGLDVIDYFTIF